MKPTQKAFISYKYNETQKLRNRVLLERQSRKGRISHTNRGAEAVIIGSNAHT